MDRFAEIGAALGREAHIAIIVADATGHIRFWNDGAVAIFGHSAEAAVGRRVDLVVPPEYRDMHWAGFNRTMHAAWTGPTVPGRSSHSFAVTIVPPPSVAA